MEYEVEQKFRVEGFGPVVRCLKERNVTLEPMFEQVDRYFAHPSRDFRETDEAFRLRRTGERNHVTYKGPRIDATTKTRGEIELPLPDGESYHSRFSTLLEALGFRPVGEVVKRRRKAFLEHAGRKVELSLDDVRGVGRYVELEIVAVEEDVEQARKVLADCAAGFGLTENERRSYLELMQTFSEHAES